MKAPIDILGLSNGARSGLTGFVAGIARKLARDGVTINNLLPGNFDTDRMRTTMQGRAKAAGKDLARVWTRRARGDSRAAASASPRSSAPCARSSAARTRAISSDRTSCSTAAPTRAPSDLTFDLMIDLYYWTTPNGHKITIFLEETALPYTVKPINISKGEQFDPEFLAISPNNRIPAIVDHAPPDGGAPLPLFESGAILLYLAGKTGRFYPRDLRGRCDVAQWLFWQMGGLGPDGRAEPPLRAVRAGEDSVRDQPLREGDAAAVSRARQAGSPTASSSPAITPSPTWRAIRGSVPSGRGRTSTSFPHLERWHATIKARPAVERAYAIVERINERRRSRRAVAQDPVRAGPEHGPLTQGQLRRKQRPVAFR